MLTSERQCVLRGLPAPQSEPESALGDAVLRLVQIDRDAGLEEQQGLVDSLGVSRRIGRVRWKRSPA